MFLLETTGNQIPRRKKSFPAQKNPFGIVNSKGWVGHGFRVPGKFPPGLKNQRLFGNQFGARTIYNSWFRGSGQLCGGEFIPAKNGGWEYNERTVPCEPKKDSYSHWQ